MTEKRYIYANIGVGFEILDSWFGYTGDGEPTEREIEEYDYLVIGLASNQDTAEGICRRLNDQQDEINHLSNFGLHIILDKKNKEIEQLKIKLEDITLEMENAKESNDDAQYELYKIKKENEQLKAQLYCDDEEGVCNICKHHYLVKDDEAELGYYTSRCKKGHYECARVSLKHCEDFEKELK